MNNRCRVLAESSCTSITIIRDGRFGFFKSEFGKNNRKKSRSLGLSLDSYLAQRNDQNIPINSSSSASCSATLPTIPLTSTSNSAVDTVDSFCLPHAKELINSSDISLEKVIALINLDDFGLYQLHRSILTKMITLLIV